MTETAKQPRRSFTDKIFGSSSASKARRSSLPVTPSTKPRRSSKTKNSLRNSTNSQPARRTSGEIDSASNPHDIIAMLEQMATHDGNGEALQAFQHLAHPDQQTYSDEEEEDRRDAAALAAANHEEVSEEFSVASTASGSGGKNRRGSKNRNSIKAVIDIALAEDALEEIMEDFE